MFFKNLFKDNAADDKDLEIKDLTEDNERLERRVEEVKSERDAEIERGKEIAEHDRETQEKYVQLLEEKSEKFDLYLDYQNKAKELSDEVRRLKRELATALENEKKAEETSEAFRRDNEKLQKKITKLEKANKEVSA